MRIHYISYFLDENEISGRKLEVAAQSKIKYIINSIKRAEFKVNVVSTALTTDKSRYSRSKELIIDSKEKHIYLSALGSRSFLEKKIKLIFMQVQLLIYLIREVKEDDIIIFYHALNYISILKLIKKIKSNKLIIEFNDLYALHFTDKDKISIVEKKEKSIFKIVDGYLLASPYMRNLIQNEKPNIISYGSYETKDIKSKIYADKINVVYTGVIENLRNAATLVAKTALFLSDDYVIHVAGYGTETNISDFINLVDSINKEKGYEAIKYHGLLLGNDFEKLLDSCHISLNAHAYSKENLWKSRYSFPSKIPLNMSHDLYLVSYNMEIIKNSPFSEFTEYFSEFSPSIVAKAIERCKNEILSSKKNKTPKDIISNLDKNFIEDIKNLINSINEDI